MSFDFCLLKQRIVGAASQGQDVEIVRLKQSGGVVARPRELRQAARVERVREYFYGIRKELAPHSQTVNTHSLQGRIYRVGTGPRAPTSALPIGATSVADPLRRGPGRGGVCWTSECGDCLPWMDADALLNGPPPPANPSQGDACCHRQLAPPLPPGCLPRRQARASFVQQHCWLCVCFGCRFDSGQADIPCTLPWQPPRKVPPCWFFQVLL